MSKKNQPGVNLVGFHNALLGLGQTARLIKRSLEHAGIPHDTVTYRNSDSREMFQQHLCETAEGAPPRYDTNLLCLNADHLPCFARQVGPAFFAGRRNIGGATVFIDRGGNGEGTISR